MRGLDNSPLLLTRDFNLIWYFMVIILWIYDDICFVQGYMEVSVYHMEVDYENRGSNTDLFCTAA